MVGAKRGWGGRDGGGVWVGRRCHVSSAPRIPSPVWAISPWAAMMGAGARP